MTYLADDLILDLFEAWPVEAINLREDLVLFFPLHFGSGPSPLVSHRTSIYESLVIQTFPSLMATSLSSIGCSECVASSIGGNRAMGTVLSIR